MHCRCTLIPIRSISFVALATPAAGSISFPRVSNLRFYPDRRRQTFFVPTIGQAFTSRAGGNGIYRTLSPARSSRPQRLAEKRPPGQKQATVTGSRFGRIDQPRPVTAIPRRRKGKRPCRHLPKVEGRSVGPDLLPGSPRAPLWPPLGWLLVSGIVPPDGVTVGPDLPPGSPGTPGFEVPAVPGAFSRVGRP